MSSAPQRPSLVDSDPSPRAVARPDFGLSLLEAVEPHAEPSRAPGVASRWPWLLGCLMVAAALWAISLVWTPRQAATAPARSAPPLALAPRLDLRAPVTALPSLPSVAQPFATPGQTPGAAAVPASAPAAVAPEALNLLQPSRSASPEAAAKIRRVAAPRPARPLDADAQLVAALMAHSDPVPLRQPLSASERRAFARQLQACAAARPARREQCRADACARANYWGRTPSCRARV